MNSVDFNSIWSIWYTHKLYEYESALNDAPLEIVNQIKLFRELIDKSRYKGGGC